MDYPRLILQGNKMASLQRQHPWVFSGAVKRKEGNPKEGDVVELFSPDGQYLATAHYQEAGSIMARVLSFSRCVVDVRFWEDKIASALQYRQAAGIMPTPETNAYRLIHAEGDGIPGLIADVYNNTVIVQAHTAGIYQSLTQIAQAIQQALGAQITAVYNKSAETLPAATQLKPQNGYLIGTGNSGNIITENGCRFWVDWESGQKTGFFLDQRNNRLQLAKWAAGKTVLNAFCYSGAFSVYALRAGANLVHSVDSSAKAMQWTDRNVELNGHFADNHQSFTSDVMPFLQNSPQKYDLIILDPPAFAKNLKSKHQAVQGYKRLNARALSVIDKGGILFTFSCSGVIDGALFYDTIRAAAIEAGRSIRLMKRLGHPPDHPVNIYHPEGEYLKGLCLYVE
ncbi:class I SAM-dependent rRNA methyltransferase [Sphingobacteriales bacterium UPWRP_1]|nr:rRNA large subunit methyltransferase I [Sphingobacteriales bacterium TSM_CSM]PSJ72244.1 class I SAM-dependent rRNA methyltransferase [Sphingobacteriales bacterium UPWRP_1]